MQNTCRDPENRFANICKRHYTLQTLVHSTRPHFYIHVDLKTHTVLPSTPRRRVQIMADTPLTALCGICHSSAPRYKCPRCAARTCSLECVTRHKQWASCSGQRDATAYVPASKLRTPSGIDHDYNFLSAIERVRSRAARDIADRTGIASAAEQPEEEERLRHGHHHFQNGNKGAQVRFRKEWRGEELVHVPLDPAAYWKQQQLEQALAKSHVVEGGSDDQDEDKAADTTSSSGSSDSDSDSEPESMPTQEPMQPQPVVTWYPQSFGTRDKARCRAFDIEVVAAPKGLARQRENKTKGNRATRGINWTIEWLVYEKDMNEPTRVLHSASDVEPLYRSFAGSMEWVRKGKERKERIEAAAARQNTQYPLEEIEDEVLEGSSSAIRRKRRRKARNAALESPPGQQEYGSTAWPSMSVSHVQNPFTSAWVQEENPMATAHGWDLDEQVDLKRTKWKYYLHKPATNPKVLIPVGAEEPLTSILQGRTVLEYPTVHAFSVDTMSQFPPPGHVAGSMKDRRSKPITINSIDTTSGASRPNSDFKSQGIRDNRDDGQHEEDPGRSHSYQSNRPGRTMRGGNRGGQHQYQPQDRKRPYEARGGGDNRQFGRGRGRGRGRGGFGHQDHNDRPMKRGRFDKNAEEGEVRDMDEHRGHRNPSRGGPSWRGGKSSVQQAPEGSHGTMMDVDTKQLERAVQAAAEGALGGLVNYSDSE